MYAPHHLLSPESPVAGAEASILHLTKIAFAAATFLSSYIHTVIIYIALCIFAFTVYAGGSDLGSPKKVQQSHR